MENQHIVARSLRQDKAFVVADSWGYLAFFDLYQRHPSCHDMSSSEEVVEVSFDYIHSANAVLDSIVQLSVALRGSFFICFLWSRPVALNIAERNLWSNALR